MPFKKTQDWDDCGNSKDITNIMKPLSTDNSLRRIYLYLTTDCNLRCKYCFEKKDSQIHNFSIPKFQEVLIREFGVPADLYIITLYGGEPFLEFEKFKNLCSWVWETYTDKNIIFDITTNGTLLNLDIKQWLLLNQKRIKVSLSIDGSRQVHDSNRGSGIFSRIELDFFLKLSGIKAKMTVMPEYVDSMFGNFIYLETLGFDTVPSIAKEAEWEEKHIELYSLQLINFVDYIVDHPNKTPPPFLRYEIGKFALERRSNRSLRNCGVCYHSIAYDTFGNKYPCNGFYSDFSREYDKNKIEEISSILRSVPDSELLVECAECPVKEACSTCYGLNYIYRNDVASIDTRLCPFIKCEIMATVQMYTRVIPNIELYPWLRTRKPNELLDIISGIQYLKDKNLY